MRAYQPQFPEQRGSNGRLISDRRVCWDCGGIGLVARAVNIHVTNTALFLIGWRELEPGGRVICSECRAERRRLK